MFLPLFILLSACRETRGQATNDYQLKAVFLCNFPQYTEWPADALPKSNAPIVIGILGADPFGTNLDETARMQRMDRRNFAIEHYRGVRDIKNCQMLYIASSESRRLPKILAALKGRSILTVSDMPDFTARGGMVCMRGDGGTIHLQINLEAMNNARLTMSSKLLRTAEIVGPKP